MNRMIRLLNYLGEQKDKLYSFGASIFVLFFLFQLVGIYQIRVENETIESIIKRKIESIENSNVKLVANMLEIETYKKRFKENNDLIRPYLYMLESLDCYDISVDEFGNQIQKDISDLKLYSFEGVLFEKLERLIKWADDFPQLKKYALSKMQQEMLLRSQSMTGVSCCFFGSSSFTTVQEVNNKYHFYPDNYIVHPCNAYIKVNGEISRGDYLWEPTNVGMHYFDIEYIDISNFQVNKKQFRMGLEVE